MGSCLARHGSSNPAALSSFVSRAKHVASFILNLTRESSCNCKIFLKRDIWKIAARDRDYLVEINHPFLTFQA